MAVKVINVSKKSGNKITASIIADTKEEVTSEMEFGEETLDFGSVAITVSGDVALLDSEGSWNWIGEEE